MRSRKIFLVALVVIVTLMLLCGCGNSHSNKEFNKLSSVTTTSTQTDSSFSTTTTSHSSTTATTTVSTTKTTPTTTTTVTTPTTIIPNVTATVSPLTVIPDTTKPQSQSYNGANIAPSTTVEQDEDISYVLTNTKPPSEAEPILEYGVNSLPTTVLNTVNYFEELYKGIEISVGIYSLDGNISYEYNPELKINSSVSIEPIYALHVLETCEEKDINIYSETLEYISSTHREPNATSDISMNSEDGDLFTIDELLRLLLDHNDTTAYNILLERFPLSNMYDELTIPINGQSDYKKWGSATISQRRNELLAINDYINSDALYASVLREYLSGTTDSYLIDGMLENHTYLKKSGCTENTPESPGTCAVGIIDNKYILIVMSQDSANSNGIHYDLCCSIGRAVEILTTSENIF